MSTKVLDSWSLMAYFGDEAGADRVEALLSEAEQGENVLLLSVVNWGEIYYMTMREEGQAKADQLAVEISTMPLRIVDVDLPLTRQAAMYKAAGRMSYADCFAAALARLSNAEIVTGDREFEAVEGEISVDWLR